MNKSELRQRLKAERLKLSTYWVQELSEKTAEQVLEILDLSSISSLHTYLPIEKQNEVDTWPFIKTVWNKDPQIKTATWHKPAEHYEPVWFDKIGFQEPVAKNFQFDLIIVPMVGFDDQLYRLGQGGGHYDRFLASQKKALKVGFCYEFGHLASLPHEPHDVPLDMIITEKRQYKL